MCCKLLTGTLLLIVNTSIVAFVQDDLDKCDAFDLCPLVDDVPEQPPKVVDCLATVWSGYERVYDYGSPLEPECPNFLLCNDTNLSTSFNNTLLEVRPWQKLLQVAPNPFREFIPVSEVFGVIPNPHIPSDVFNCTVDTQTVKVFHKAGDLLTDFWPRVKKNLVIGEVTCGTCMIAYAAAGHAGNNLHSFLLGLQMAAEIQMVDGLMQPLH